MEFTYDEYDGLKWTYPESFNAYETLDTVALKQQEDAYMENNGLDVDDVLGKLEERTTSKYFKKVQHAQLKAREYAKKVFPTYKFILPDALIDDWLSTVDMHGKHPGRDHSLHQSLAAYIVGKLLGFGNPADSLVLENGNNLLETCAKQLYDGPEMEYMRNYIRQMDPDFDNKRKQYDMGWAINTVYETAVISALFHDMGYPWQYVLKLSTSIGTANYKDVMKIMTDSQEVLGVIGNRLLAYPLYGYDENVVNNPSGDQKKLAEDILGIGLRKTHGTPGALGFMNLNNNIRKYGRSDIFFETSFRVILDWAAVGIMMHDMPKVYWGGNDVEQGPKQPILRVDFKKDPISCLVSLADILEEFHRPSAHFQNLNKAKVDEYVSVIYDFACKSSSVRIENGEIVITYTYYSEKERNDFKKKREDEVREYLNPGNGFLDLSSWGIGDVRCETIVSNIKMVKA